MGDSTIKNKWKPGLWGSQSVRRNGNKGKPRGYTLSGNPNKNKIAFAATLRAASGHPQNPCGVHDFGPEAVDFPAIRIRTSDMRYQRFTHKEKMGILFVVDASRSQGADRRLAFAKGAILALLRQVYERRDRAGLIIFGNKKAELVLPFTRSVEYAGKRLVSLSAFGNTPLAMGLRKALETIEMAQKKDAFLNPLIVLVTDGKANYDEKAGQPLELALETAETIRRSGIPVVVIDTEKGYFRLGIAKRLADRMDACYLTLG